jgi:hypothetical protein
MVIAGLPPLQLPVRTALLMTARVIVMPDDTMLTALVVTPAGGRCADSGPFSNITGCSLFVVIESTDRSARKWRVKGTLPPELLPASLHFGCDTAHCNMPSEHDMEILPDGQLIMAARTGTPNPLMMARSPDLGKTWVTYPHPIAWSVYPRLLRLANGVVLLAAGRPGVGLWVTADGHGDSWTYHNMAGVHNVLLAGNTLFSDDHALYTEPYATFSNWSFCGWATAGFDCNRTECLADGIVLNRSQRNPYYPSGWPSAANPRCSQNWEADQSEGYFSLTEAEPNVALLTYDQLSYGGIYPQEHRGRGKRDTVFAVRITVIVKE